MAQHFLVDASLPRSTSIVIKKLGFEASDVRDIGLGDAPDAAIAEHALRNCMVLLTRDFDFADVRNYPPADYQGIVLVDLPSEISVRSVIGVVEGFLMHADLINSLPGNLVILEFGRIRVRPG